MKGIIQWAVTAWLVIGCASHDMTEARASGDRSRSPVSNTERGPGQAGTTESSVLPASPAPMAGETLGLKGTGSGGGGGGVGGRIVDSLDGAFEIDEDTREEVEQAAHFDSGKRGSLARAPSPKKPSRPRPKPRSVRGVTKKLAAQRQLPPPPPTIGASRSSTRPANGPSDAPAPPEEASKTLAGFGMNTLQAPTSGDLADHWHNKKDKNQAPSDALNIDGKIAPAQNEAFGWSPSGTLTKPDHFLPRACYFENTYLGGNAAHRAQARRVRADLGSGPWDEASLHPQAFDPPAEAGLALSTRLDVKGTSGPRRVLLQIGLQGSDRHSFRRPPMDLVLVVDDTALARPAWVNQAVSNLTQRLDTSDRLAVVGVGLAAPTLAPLDSPEAAPAALAQNAVGQTVRVNASLSDGLLRAGQLLEQAATDPERPPGARTIMILSARPGASQAALISPTVHGLSLQGVVTSVISLGQHADGWWPVANAGHGHHHHASTVGQIADAIDSELKDLARVVARLIRVNIKLAKHVKAHRIIGAKVLEAAQIKQVKAREEATDRNLSKTMGLDADRGDDDDGIQTVIPYFLGSDQHVILVELWVEGPGPVAEVSLRYKDLTRLKNATAHSAVHIEALSAPTTVAELEVRQAERTFAFAMALKTAAQNIRANRPQAARDALRVRGLSGRQRRLQTQMLHALARSAHRPEATASAFELASERLRGGK